MINAAVNLAGNIGLFIPYGFLLPGTVSRFRNIRNTLVLCLATFVFSGIIQLLTGRSMDVDDVILNCLGAAAVFGLWRVALHCCFRIRAGGKTDNA